MDKKLVFLFVCSGNTCRSVMAQGLLTKIWGEPGEKEIQAIVYSAGMETIDGLSATDEALQVLWDEGVDLTCHRSRRITDTLVREADYIFTMTKKQKETLLEHFPEAFKKVWMIAEFAYDDNFKDVFDPFGLGLQKYRQTAKEIKAAIREIVNKLTVKPSGKIADQEN